MKEYGLRGLLCALFVAACLCRPVGTACAEQSLIGAELSYQRLVFSSRQTVHTWKQDGVRVFVAEGGAEVRQGRVRLAAPKMVVWFDQKKSSSPQVRAACVQVYAEGTGEVGQKPTQPVRLVEGERARSYAAAFVSFRSKLAFVWDCPLRSAAEPQELAFFQKARLLTEQAEADFTRELIPEGPKPKRRPGKPEILLADEQYYFADEQEGKLTSVYLGDVRLRHYNVNVRADAAVVWLDEKKHTYEIYAHGNVRLSRSETAPAPPTEIEDKLLRSTKLFESLRADEVYINPDRERALATDTELRLRGRQGKDMYVFAGEEIYLIDSDNLYVRKGSATTCPFAHPHYRVSADRLRVSRVGRSTFVNAWDTRLQLGETEVPLLPFASLDLARKSYLIRTLAMGNSDKFGLFLRSGWQPGDLGLTAPWLKDWTLNLDYYSDRGPAIGSDLEYEYEAESGPVHSGDITSYYVRDTKNEDATGLPVLQKDRGRFRLRHRTRWNERWRTDVEYYYLSDRGFLDEYFENEFEEDKRPESYVLTRYRHDSTWAGLLFKKQVNEFLTQVEEKPSAEIRWIGLPLEGWVYEGGFAAGRYDLEQSEFTQLADPPGLYRAHTSHTLSRPFSVGFMRLDPFATVLGTLTSKGQRQPGYYSGSEERAAAGGGIYASTDLSRCYDVQSKLFNLNRLRHIVTPYVGFQSLAMLSGDSEDFIQMDETDATDRSNRFSAGIRQRLQTKRGAPGRWRSANVLELDVDYVNRSDDSVAYRGDDQFVEIDLTLMPTENFNIHSLDNRLSLSGRTDVVNIGASLDLSPAARLTVDFDHISNLSSQLSTELACRLSDRWGLRIKEKYEFNSLGTGRATNLKTQAHLLRLLHCWLLDLGIEHDEVNNDFALMVGFSHAPGKMW